MKVIMIDGFKPEYLEYAPYLKSLTEKYQWGELDVGVGHWGVEETLFFGKSDKLALFCKKENSSLRCVKYFTWLKKFGEFGRLVLDSIINFKRLIKRQDMFRTGKIPFNRLWKFDFCVDKPFYKIAGIEREYFGSIDKFGHKFGTKSEEVKEEIRKIDRKILKTNFDLIFSDHGMIDIEKTISVPITEDCFIDSDMARYWGSEEELRKIEKNLPLVDGKIINWPDKKFGDLIFLANAGILILPNFWQGKEKAKAMHGYDGKHKDLKGFYVVKKNGKRKDINVKELHKIFKQIKENGPRS